MSIEAVESSMSEEIFDSFDYNQNAQEGMDTIDSKISVVSQSRIPVHHMILGTTHATHPKVLLCTDDNDEWPENYSRGDNENPNPWSGELDVNANIDSDGKKSAKMDVRESYHDKNGRQFDGNASVKIDDHGKVSGSIGVGTKW